MSKKIKIVSNPYEREIKYFDYNETNDEWEDIFLNNPNSGLRENDFKKSFLPFKVKEIIDIIIDEYYKSDSKLEIYFEGTNDEFNELKVICEDEEVASKIKLEKLPKTLENARIIFPNIKERFEEVDQIIEKIVKDNKEVKKDLDKVSETLKDVIPICVFGNYSVGKSTFINALIGNEILQSGGDPVTAKVYKIRRSKDDDVSRIKFTYQEKDCEILLEGDKYRYREGDNYRLISETKDNPLIVEIDKILKETPEKNLILFVNLILEHINNYEKSKNINKQIGNVIEVEVPFSRKGILGQSYNNFVIFDTPGSNSKTNLDHTKVLEEALDGFSNGIPILVATYETLDTTDNATLCEKMLGIKALDERFSMIVLNKADGSDLSDSEEEIKKELLSYNAVQKMHASGIYFVSSIMGLGAKNEGQLIDKHYRKVYRSQEEMYKNPNDEDYADLYRYNVMPKQIKSNAINYSLECPNVIYANSGLYTIEMEIEKFASRYAAYNKCQMVYKFLKDINEETNQKIESKKEILNSDIEKRNTELESEKQTLIEEISNKILELIEKYSKESEKIISSYKFDNYTLIEKNLEERKQSFDYDYEKEKNLEKHEKESKNAWNNIWNNFKSISSLKGKANSLKEDFKEYQEMKKKEDMTIDEIDSKTADKVMEYVINLYKTNATNIRDERLKEIEKIWQDYAKEFKDELLSLVMKTDLPNSQREDISNIILKFNSEIINEEVDNKFVKSKYLEWKLLRFGKSNEISVKKLDRSYNSKIKDFGNTLVKDINRYCKDTFIKWKDTLEEKITDNITEYNPDLKGINDIIKEDKEKIKELKQDQDEINDSMNDIKKWISWNDID